MATYNGGRFLRDQIASIVGQTVLPDELVVCDDGSTDDTLALLSEQAGAAPFPIRVHRNQSRLGFSGNFRAAINRCRSEIVFLCDQDDIWHPDKIRVMLDAFDDPSSLLAYHDALIVDEQNREQHELYDGDAEKLMLKLRPMHPWRSSYGLTQAFRSALLAYDDLWDMARNHVWTEDEPLAHDQWFFFLAQVLGRVTFVDQALVRYRQHQSNAVGAGQEQAGRQSRYAIRARLDHVPRLDSMRAQAAERRAHILDELGRRIAGDGRERTRRMAHAYRDLAARLGRRYRTYAGTGAGARAASWSRAVLAGDYLGGAWRFAPAAAAKDALGGVIGLGVESADPARP